ncbi:MAG TPA: RNA polymerase sigma-70 factor [Chitinophagaceae bacterium]|nr:RNA polymerase sigma-70 factor [Chitinophagaceae bacterium]
MSGPLYNERELLICIADGDQKAFTRLVDMYWNKVYGHALAYTKSSPRAQEITQDVFLQVWIKRQTLSEVNDFNNFLFILGKNKIISSMRKKLDELAGKEPVDLLEDVLLPDRQLEYKQVYHQIMEAIENLPPTRKLVFKMSRIEGLTYEEISQRLNISRNTVKEHIVRGLSFIRTFIHTHAEMIFWLLYLYFVDNKTKIF